MRRIETDKIDGAPVALTDGAVGVSPAKKCWFVAVVNNHSEKKSASSISQSGYSSFVPVQKEKRKMSDGSVRIVERVIVAASVFVYCTEKERREVVKNPMVKRFMVDRSKSPVDGHCPIAVIPDEQMRVFRSLIECSEDRIDVFPYMYESGEQIRILKGSLNGVEGRVISSGPDTSRIAIALGTLGSAIVHINNSEISKI